MTCFTGRTYSSCLSAHRNMVHNRIRAANWQRSENLGEQTIIIAPGTGLGITVNTLFPRKMSWDSHCLYYFSNYWISISCKIHTVKFQLLLQGLRTTGKGEGTSPSWKWTTLQQLYSSLHSPPWRSSQAVTQNKHPKKCISVAPYHRGLQIFW